MPAPMSLMVTEKGKVAATPLGNSILLGSRNTVTSTSENDYITLRYSCGSFYHTYTQFTSIEIEYSVAWSWNKPDKS